MVNYIEFRTGCDEWNKRFFRAKAHIIAHVPEVGNTWNGWEFTSVEPAYLDPEQPNDEVYAYDIYSVECVDAYRDEDDENPITETHYLAVKTDRVIDEYIDDYEEDCND